MKYASILLWALVALLFTQRAFAQTLDQELQSIPAGELAKLARLEGDAQRGAIVFFQPSMACSKCHAVGKSKPNPLGPDLADRGPVHSDEHLVESVLFPSKVIRPGFEGINALMADGSLRIGLLVEDDQQHLRLRDIQRNGELVVLNHADIEEVNRSSTSIMPTAQVNQLNSQQQFYDLIRYLIEIRDGGEARAVELQPSASLLTLVVPEYEQHLDHRSFIKEWNKASLKRGEAIYQRVCVNCHGTKDQPGSLPTSLRFAEGKFKNGSDPLSMYRTLTHGFGLMAPQTWMVPSQKYDVIHYIREKYLKPHNVSQYTPLGADYLAKLPEGDTRGPEPSTIVAWSAMDYGPSLIHTYEVPSKKLNIAYKGIAMRLDPGAGGVSRGRYWMVFDTDTLRAAAAWRGSDEPTKNFIDWQGIQFNGAHQVHPKIVGETSFTNSTGPGWADPTSGSFNDDQRVIGRDDRRYGPLPKRWGQFHGLYHYGQQTILSYSVGSTEILEAPSLQHYEDRERASFFLRTFNIGPRDRELSLQVADQLDPSWQLTVTELSSHSVARLRPKPTRATINENASSLPDSMIAGVTPSTTKFQWQFEEDSLRLKIPAGTESLKFTLWIPASATVANNRDATVSTSLSVPMIAQADQELMPLTQGGPARWPQRLETKILLGADQGPLTADELLAPESNPWLALTRFTGLDFFPDGRIAVCSWDGDVWIVEPLASSDATGAEQKLRWQRIASGLFQPLGLKIVNNKIHLTCRDQLTVLHDLNGDGETDFYQCLNNDHQVTEHFHEFAMGLQIDDQGNFYYAKSGCHARPAVVPHHGTLLKVAADGSTTEILANGFRAANGVCLNPDGSFLVTDQEGFWNPKNRINWVTVDPGSKPRFYGNMLGYHDVTDSSDSAMEPPLCWITNAFDRSPAELLWVQSERWGKLNGSLLNFSYGYGKVFLVLHESVQGVNQGGMIELPLPNFPTGVMRGRFSPIDGQLYVCGMFAWAGNATKPGGLYRIRKRDEPIHVPQELHATTQGLTLTFTEPLDADSVTESPWIVKVWGLKRTAKYGSDHINERLLVVDRATLSEDGKTVRLAIQDLQPTWGMEIKYSVRTKDGVSIQGTIHNTIHRLAEES